MANYLDYDYSENQQYTIYYANLVVSSLSILGSIFIIILYFCYPSLRRLPFRLIFYLTIADLGNSIGMAIPYMKSYPLCQIQGYFVSYFGLSSLLWCAFIAHAISLTVLYKKDISKYEKLYLVIGFVLPVLSFLVLIDIHEYKVALGWCWIMQTNYVNFEFYRQIAYRLITYYLPLLFVFMYITVQHFKVISEIKASDIFKPETRKYGQAMILKLKMYPIIMIGSLLPVVIIRLMSFSITPHWYMTLIGGVGISLGGFLNSIVYGLTQEVKMELSKTFSHKQIEELLTVDDHTNSSV